MKAPPPFSAAWTGNRKKFPKPIALPAMAKISPVLLSQNSLLFGTFHGHRGFLAKIAVTLSNYFPFARRKIR
jgi:hypothetical protein